MSTFTIDYDTAFQNRFSGIVPVNAAIRDRIIQDNNVKDFFVANSCMADGQNGLYANKFFKKGDLLGTYHGESCKMKDLISAKRSAKNYNHFVKKYGIITTLNRRNTLKLIESLGYAIGQDEFLVMPRYPVDPNWYLKYNAMLFVNEPPDKNAVYNHYLLKEQPCEINALSFTNYTWNTIDYVASKDIYPNEEIVVYYGNAYSRKNYQINRDGCNQLNNKVFF